MTWGESFIYIAISLAIIIIVILTLIEVYLKRKQSKIEISPNKKILKNLQKEKNLQKKLDKLDDIAKKILKEDYGISGTYTELTEEFKKRKNYKAAEFCQAMSLIYYSPEKVTPGRANILIEKLLGLVK